MAYTDIQENECLVDRCNFVWVTKYNDHFDDIIAYRVNNSIKAPLRKYNGHYFVKQDSFKYMDKIGDVTNPLLKRK